MPVKGSFFTQMQRKPTQTYNSKVENLKKRELNSSISVYLNYKN